MKGFSQKLAEFWIFFFHYFEENNFSCLTLKKCNTNIICICLILLIFAADLESYNIIKDKF